MKQKYQPLQTHANHKWMYTRGQWGPHKIKVICLDCAGAFVKWDSLKNKSDRKHTQ